MEDHPAAQALDHLAGRRDVDEDRVGRDQAANGLLVRSLDPFLQVGRIRADCRAHFGFPIMPWTNQVTLLTKFASGVSPALIRSLPDWS